MPKQKRKNARVNENTNPDVSLLDNGDDRVLKKETLIRDFDIQVKSRIQNMETQKALALADLTRIASAAKITINRKIRQMTVKIFLEQGGHLHTLQFSEVNECMNPADVSFVNPKTTPLAENDTLTNPAKLEDKRIKRKDTPNEQPTTTTTRSGRKVNIGKKPAAPQPKVIKRRLRPGETSLIAPKFDINKPLRFARNPKDGETLLSLQGSPVVTHLPNSSADDTALVSLSLNAEKAILGGSLFSMDTMSPATLLRNKEVMIKVMGAVTSKLEDLNKHLGKQSIS